LEDAEREPSMSTLTLDTIYPFLKMGLTSTVSPIFPLSAGIFTVVVSKGFSVNPVFLWSVLFIFLQEDANSKEVKIIANTRGLDVCFIIIVFRGYFLAVPVSDIRHNVTTKLLCKNTHPGTMYVYSRILYVNNRIEGVEIFETSNISFSCF